MSGDRGYITWRPTWRVRERLDVVRQVLDDYRDHLPLTLRQIFYVLVGRQAIDKTQAEYRNLGYALRKARRARLIPFEAIHDQGSVLPYSLLGHISDDSLRELIRAVVATFDLDPQLHQPRRVVLWCEAAGMLAQLERVARPYGVHVVTGGGFDSVSDKWGFAKLVRQAGASFEVLHIGDLDPHGEDIFEVLAEDVQAFDGHKGMGFTRLAVTDEQVDELDLPHDPDERLVQAEAIPPDVLADIVNSAIREQLDLDLMADVAERSAAIRAETEERLQRAGLWAGGAS